MTLKILIKIINVCSLNHFKEFFRTNDSSTKDYTSIESPADGAFIGFKLRLFYNTGSSKISGGVLHRSSGSQIYKTIITPHHPDKTAWLKFVDLTGCYLIEESGSPSVSSVDSIIGNKVQPIYVYAQEVTDGSNQVELYTEVALTNGKAYRIMQPNPVCFYEESPDNIKKPILKRCMESKKIITFLTKVVENIKLQTKQYYPCMLC